MSTSKQPPSPSSLPVASQQSRVRGQRRAASGVRQLPACQPFYTIRICLPVYYSWSSINEAILTDASLFFTDVSRSVGG